MFSFFYPRFQFNPHVFAQTWAYVSASVSLFLYIYHESFDLELDTVSSQNLSTINSSRWEDMVGQFDTRSWSD